MTRIALIAITLLSFTPDHAAAAKKTYTADDVLQSYTCGSLDFSAGLSGTMNEEKQCEIIPPLLRMGAMEAGKAAAASLRK
jgi:hypothetical protein